MVLFGIPDIRLFWSQDHRFLQQFAQGTVSLFQPFSKYPECYKDVSFWLNDNQVSSTGGEGQAANFHENDLMELLREEGGDLVEDVQLVWLPLLYLTSRWMNLDIHRQVAKACVTESIIDPWKGIYSPHYKLKDKRSLSNAEVNEIQERVRNRLIKTFSVELR